MAAKRWTVIALAVLTLGAVWAEEANDLDPEKRIDILPPKYLPGHTMPKTSFESITKALKDIDRAVGILEFESVSIGIAVLDDNAGPSDHVEDGTSKSLYLPTYKMVDGEVKSNLPIEIKPGNTGLHLFQKAFITEGTYGAVAYNIKNTDLKVAVMFHVPVALGGKNRFSFKVFHKDTPVDRKMVRHMRSCSGSWIAEDGYQGREDYGIKLLGTMTENNHARLVVWVDLTEFNRENGPHLNAWCQKKGVVLTKRWCRKECNDVGLCWTNHRCRGDADCDPYQMPCSERCKNC